MVVSYIFHTTSSSDTTEINSNGKKPCNMKTEQKSAKKKYKKKYNNINFDVIDKTRDPTNIL